MPETTQQIAYIPMIFPDADFSRSEINSLPLIQSIDKSVKELKHGLYEHQRISDNRLTNLENNVSGLKNDVANLKNDVMGLKTELSEPRGRRLIIKNKDLYVNLPETAEGFDILKKFFDMQTAQKTALATAGV